MIGLIVLFLIPIYYLAKSKGYHALWACVLCGLIGLLSPYLLQYIFDWPLLPFADCTVALVTLIIVWFLPAKQGAPGKAYLHIECSCPVCNAHVSFHRHEEGKAVLCPACGEIMTVPLDKYSSAREKPKRERPAVTAGEVCFDTFGNEMAAHEIKALLEGNGLAAEVIAGTGSGALTQLGIDQGFKLIIDAKDWDKVVELVATAEQAAAPAAKPPASGKTGQWTRQPDAELRLVTRRWWCEFAKACAIGALLVAPFCTVLRGWRVGAIKGYWVPPEEWPRRFPFGLLVGAVVGGIYYLAEQRKKTLVCLTCGRCQPPGHSPCCSCGGTLEDIRNLKWLAAPDSTQRVAEPVRCLVCDGILPAAADRCPKCGWTYKEQRPEPGAGG